MCKGLISFSLYGSVVKYVLGLYENLTLAPTVYPGWKVRVYIERGHYSIDKIKRDWPNVEVVEREPALGSSGMFWRLEAAYDTNYSHVIVRDVDSRLTEREAHLVKEWVESGKHLHIIRDHPAHNGVPILGGAHGYMPEHFKQLEDYIKYWHHSNKYGDDEHFLRITVYDKTPRINVLAHSSQTKTYGDETNIAESNNGFICQPVPPPFEPYLSKLYVLNAKHYYNRYTKFLGNLRSSKILSSLEVVRVEGTPVSDDVVPEWAHKTCPHYWVATQDHKQILKERILAKDDLALIFEDDAKPLDDFDEYFNRMWKFADPYYDHNTQHAPWTCLMLGGQTSYNRELLQNHTSQQIARTTGTRGQHSVLYNYKGMNEFYSHAMYWNYKTIDEAFESYQAEKGTVYCPAKWITEITGTQFGKDN